MAIVLALGLAIIAPGCATTSAAPPHKLYPGPERPREELAIVLLADPNLISVEIDGPSRSILRIGRRHN